jgi:hypothetical protein
MNVNWRKEWERLPRKGIWIIAENALAGRTNDGTHITYKCNKTNRLNLC